MACGIVCYASLISASPACMDSSHLSVDNPPPPPPRCEPWICTGRSTRIQGMIHGRAGCPLTVSHSLISTLSFSRPPTRARATPRQYFHSEIVIFNFLRSLSLSQTIIVLLRRKTSPVDPSSLEKMDGSLEHNWPLW